MVCAKLIVTNYALNGINKRKKKSAENGYWQIPKFHIHTFTDFNMHSC